MGLQKSVIKHIDDLVADVESSISKIDLATNLSPSSRESLKDDLNEIALSALDDARRSIESEPDNPYFMMPLLVACIEIGRAYGIVGEGVRFSKRMSDYARLKLQKDPKQIEKQFVFDCWRSWQAKPNAYNSKAAFARDMLTKCEHLSSQKKIEDWCREWEAQVIGVLPAE